MGEEQYFNALVTNLNKGLLFFFYRKKEGFMHSFKVNLVVMVNSDRNVRPQLVSSRVYHLFNKSTAKSNPYRIKKLHYLALSYISNQHYR